MRAIAVVGGCATVNLLVALWIVLTRPALNSDFRGLWSFARFARRHAGQIYQAAPLQAFQQQIYPGFRSFFPYQYPPGFLLAIGWLGDFPYAMAAAIWTLTGLAALMLAGAIFFRPGIRCFAIAALLGSPAALLNGVAGETGFFSTALLLLGAALLRARPWAAGLAFGLLTLKPQLGVLLPLALLARGDPRALAAASLTALALIGLSCAVFPAHLCLDWLRSLPAYQAQYRAAGKTLDPNAVVTIAGNLLAFGAAPGFAWRLQATVSLGVAAAVFLAFRHAPYRLAVASLFAGTLLCTPHAYAYDTLPLIAALLLLEPPAGGAAAGAGSAVCGLAYLSPYLLLSPWRHWFAYTIPETLVFTAIIYLAFGAGPRPNIRHEPIPAGESRLVQR